MTPLTPVSPQVGRLHGSVPNLSRYLESSQSQLPFSLPPEYTQLQRSFWVLAQKGAMGRGGLSLDGGVRAGFGVLTLPGVSPGSARLAQQRGGRAGGREGPSGGNAASAGPAVPGPTARQRRHRRGEGAQGTLGC